jgi:hypothetical protein
MYTHLVCYSNHRPSDIHARLHLVCVEPPSEGDIFCHYRASEGTDINHVWRRYALRKLVSPHLINCEGLLDSQWSQYWIWSPSELAIAIQFGPVEIPLLMGLRWYIFERGDHTRAPYLVSAILSTQGCSDSGTQKYHPLTRPLTMSS